MANTYSIIIDGYDVTTYAKDLPSFDDTVPEWGTMADIIMNSNIQINFKKILYDIFTGQDIRSMPLLITQDNIILFNGYIDNIIVYQNYITITAKAKTDALFNSYLKDSSSGDIYVIDDTYAIDIIKEILDLAGLTLNSDCYSKALSIHQQYEIKFSVTTETFSYAEIIEKICEVTCAIVYMYNDEFYYTMFDISESAGIPIDDSCLFSFPIFENPPAFSSTYNGIDIKFGNDVSLYGLSNPTKTIDMSISSSVYTYSITAAQYIANLYDYLGNAEKQVLKVDLKKRFKNIIKRGDYLSYNDNVYRIITLTNDSKIKVGIQSERLYY